MIILNTSNNTEKSKNVKSNNVEKVEEKMWRIERNCFLSSNFFFVVVGLLSSFMFLFHGSNCGSVDDGQTIPTKATKAK